MSEGLYPIGQRRPLDDDLPIDPDRASANSGEPGAEDRGASRWQAARGRAKPSVLGAIAVEAALGAPARYGVAQVIVVTTDSFPWATSPGGPLLVNVAAPWCSGMLTGLALYHAFPATPKVVPCTGFCGDTRPFPRSAFETVRLLEEEALEEALLNAMGTLVTCAGAAGLGLAVAAL